MTPVSPANGILWGVFETRPFWRVSDLWYLHRVLVIFAVVGSNIHWEWAPKHSFVPPSLGCMWLVGRVSGLRSFSGFSAPRARR
jgi:hypothetical protein